MLFLMVSAVRAPTVMAPTISKMVPRTMAWRYETEREDTDVAHALATSSGVWLVRVLQVSDWRQHTSTVVVGVEQGEEGANGEDIVVLGELRHGDVDTAGRRSW
jgi:hypothetical protein